MFDELTNYLWSLSTKNTGEQVGIDIMLQQRAAHTCSNKADRTIFFRWQIIVASGQYIASDDFQILHRTRRRLGAPGEVKINQKVEPATTGKVGGLQALQTCALR